MGTTRILLIFLLQFFDFAQDFIEPLLIPTILQLLQNRDSSDPVVKMVREVCGTTSSTCQEILEEKKILKTSKKSKKRKKKKKRKKEKALKPKQVLDLSNF